MKRTAREQVGEEAASFSAWLRNDSTVLAQGQLQRASANSLLLFFSLSLSPSGCGNVVDIFAFVEPPRSPPWSSVPQSLLFCFLLQAASNVICACESSGGGLTTRLLRSPCPSVPPVCERSACTCVGVCVCVCGIPGVCLWLFPSAYASSQIDDRELHSLFFFSLGNLLNYTSAFFFHSDSLSV